MGYIIGAVISAAASYFSGKAAAEAASKLTPQQQQLFNYIIQNTKSASDFGKLVMGLSKDPIIGGVNWMQTLSSGDRAAIQQVVGPQMAQIGQSAQQSLQTMAQVAPRSGASASFLSSLPYSTALAQNQLSTGLQNQAKFGQLSAGQSLAGLGMQGLSSADQTGMSGLNFLQNKQQYGAQVGADTASSTYSMLNNILGGQKNMFGQQTSPGLIDTIGNWIKGMGSGGGSQAWQANYTGQNSANILRNIIGSWQPTSQGGFWTGTGN